MSLNGKLNTQIIYQIVIYKALYLLKVLKSYLKFYQYFKIWHYFAGACIILSDSRYLPLKTMFEGVIEIKLSS